MRAWQTPQGVLYLADKRRALTDTQAPPRPSEQHVWVDGQGWVPDLAGARVKAQTLIDEKAEEVRLRYITPGAGQAGTYLIKERQAEEYARGGYGSPVPAMVQAEVDATGLTPQQACALILGQRDVWLAKAADIERERRKGKVLVEAANTLIAIRNRLALALRALDAL